MTQQGPPPQLPPAQQRLLAVDPGARRTGIAISDELGMFAHARPAIVESRTERVADSVIAMAAGEGVSEIVVGRPLSLLGGDSAQTAAARAFVQLLRGRCSIRVSEWDERLSTVEAAREVKGAANRRSGVLDSAAAAVILQAVLDSRRDRVPS